MDFSQWLVDEQSKRGWSQREFARRAGISHTSISEVISGNRAPGWDFCAGIAQALGMSPVEVMIRAGLLPGRPGQLGEARAAYYANSLTVEEIELIELYRQLGPGLPREWALTMLKGWLDQTKGQGHGESTR